MNKFILLIASIVSFTTIIYCNNNHFDKELESAVWWLRVKKVETLLNKKQSLFQKEYEHLLSTLYRRVLLGKIFDRVEDRFIELGCIGSISGFLAGIFGCGTIVSYADSMLTYGKVPKRNPVPFLCGIVTIFTSSIALGSYALFKATCFFMDKRSEIIGLLRSKLKESQR